MSNKNIDMAWGHPSFMKDYWSDFPDVSIISISDGIKYRLDAGSEDLHSAISLLHTEESNFKYQDKHLVVGSGATQIIRAVTSLYSGVFTPSPYYSRFPDLAKAAGASFTSDKSKVIETPDHKTLEIITYPNNPDGKKQAPSLNTARLYDLCYNWSQYTPVDNMDVEMAVFGLSKATGHAGIRIGWGYFADKALADKVQSFIEIDSNGVSVSAQMFATKVITHQLSLPKHRRCFHFGRYELKYRWAKMKQNLVKDSNVKIINSSGMFALLQVEKGLAAEHFFTEYNVLGVSGSCFGLDDSYVRLNMGCETEDFDRFIKTLE